MSRTGRGPGAPLGNQNGKGGPGRPTLKEAEKAARRKADELLNRATPYAVRALIRILTAKDSTNMDRHHAAVAILDRKIPRVTQESLLLKDARRVILEIPDLGWPPPLKVVNGDE